MMATRKISRGGFIEIAHGYHMVTGDSQLDIREGEHPLARNPCHFDTVQTPQCE